MNSKITHWSLNYNAEEVTFFCEDGTTYYEPISELCQMFADTHNNEVELN